MKRTSGRGSSDEDYIKWGEWAIVWFVSLVTLLVVRYFAGISIADLLRPGIIGAAIGVVLVFLHFCNKES